MFKSKHLKFIFFAIILLVVSYPLIIGIYYWGIIGLFNYITNAIVNTTGISPYLVKAIVILFIAPLVVFFGFGLSLSPKKRKIARIIIATYAIIFYLGLFFLTRDQKFDFETGEATKYYAVTPEGIRYFDKPGFDPKFGIPLKPVDRDLAARDIKRKPEKVDDPTLFFCSITREPLFWYYENTDGSFEFYNMPGYHQKYGILLKPVTSDIVNRYQAQEQARIKASQEAEEQKRRAAQAQEQTRIKAQKESQEKEKIRLFKEAEEQKRRAAQAQEQARIKAQKEELERQPDFEHHDF
jgi:hypothetical protein